MHRHFLSRLWAPLIVVSFVAPVHADDGWSLSTLNPFASKPKTSKPASPSRKVSETKAPGWSLNPFAKKSTTSAPIKNATSRRKAEPSTLTKTWEALTPWDDHPPKKPAPLTKPRPTKAKTGNEKGWWESMFGPEEPPRPSTVNEWLEQEKPSF